MDKQEFKKLIRECILEYIGENDNKIEIFESNRRYKKFGDGTEIELDGSRLSNFIFKGKSMDVSNFKNLGTSNGWTKEESNKIYATLKGDRYTWDLNPSRTHTMEFYPEATGGPVYFDVDSSD